MGRLELVMETMMVSIYSPRYDGRDNNEFEDFLLTYKTIENKQLKAYFNAIVAAIDKIGRCGARENLFRLEGGKVKAIPLYFSYHPINKAIGKMRLYCLRLSEKMLIIGNGGISIEQKYENDAKMSRYVKDLRIIGKKIERALNKANLNFEDYNDLKTAVESIII